MQINKNKTIATIIAIVLVCSIAISFGNLKTTQGVVINGINYDQNTAAAINQGMNWDLNANASALRLTLFNRFHDQIPTHVFIITAPNPIGVGQQCNIVMFNPQVPPAASLYNTIRYYYTFQVTTPNGTVENFPSAHMPAYSSWSQNSIATLNGKTVFGSDSTGSTYMSYIPEQVGNYTFEVTYLQIQYTANINATNHASSSVYSPFYTSDPDDYYGTTFLSSNFTTTLTVQQEPVSLTGLTAPSYSPIPAQYWSRPIEQENTQWFAIASNWLHTNHDFNNGGYQNAYQPDGTAPTTGHILWTLPTEDSGVLGGSDTSRSGNTFNTGSQYQPRFTNPIIMYGRLYYSPDLYTSGSSELLDCVDLKTGQLLWEENTTSFYNPVSGFAAALGTSSTANVPSFGYYYSQDDPNEHGIQNQGWLFTSNYGIGYQPARGIPQLHIANVPSTSFASAAISEITGPSGENLRYVFTNLGTPSNPNWYLAQWNSSKVIPMIMSSSTVPSLTIEGNVPITPSLPQYTSWTTAGIYWNGTAYAKGSASAAGIVQTTTLAGQPGGPSYDFNVTSPIQFTTTPTIAAASLTTNGGILWGWNSSQGWPTGTSGPSYAYEDNVTVWAISLNPSTLGQLIYMKTIQTDDPVTNTNFMIEHADANAGVFVTMSVPDMTFYIYNMTTGDLIGHTDSQAQTITPYNYYTWPSLISMTQTKVAYGMLYTGGYGGSVSAYYLNNASLAWRYEVIPPGTAGVIKSSPGMMDIIADGKVYVGVHEHSAETPLEAGNNMKVLNATTGMLISEWPAWPYPLSVAVADGVLVYWNDYDGQIYAAGQGPTQMTVTAPSTASPVGTDVVIRGTVTDVSPGTQQPVIKADYPNGVPAVSDDSMSSWMAQVYMQKTASNITGVPVTIDVIDANGNYRNIGTTTSDASGMFTFSWKPDIEGSYTVVATFHGSQSYYGTYAETSFAASAAPTTAPTSTSTVSLESTQMYILGIGAAIIVVVVIIGAVILMALRKRP